MSNDQSRDPPRVLRASLAGQSTLRTGSGVAVTMNRILSVVRSMTDKIIELSRGVVTAPFYGESKRAVGVDQVDTVMLMTRE